MTEKKEVDTTFELVDTAPALQTNWNSHGSVSFENCHISSSLSLTLFFLHVNIYEIGISKKIASC
jgi:hypothetical protein